MDQSVPDNWTIRWEPDHARDALGLTPSAIASDEALSLAFLRRGLAPWGRTEFPLGAIEILLRQYPRLDEIWCLYMWSRRERGESILPHWERVGQYVDDCKQGHWTESVAPERAVQSVFAAIVQHTLRREKPDQADFLEYALLLCAHVDHRLAEGRDLLSDVVTDHPRLERYVAMLQADEKLYHEDIARGLRRIATITSMGQERQVPLLALRHPVATQFKLWARQDVSAPFGAGYPIMLVEHDESIVLSVDPSRKLDIGWLAAKLDAAESAARGDTTGIWYDGARHDGTIVAAPGDGTTLSFEQIVEVLDGELRFRRVRDPVRWSRFAAIAGAAAVAAIAAVLFVAKPWEARPAPTPPPPAPTRVDVYRRVAPLTALFPGVELGSGVVVANNLVLTNFHVVKASMAENYGMQVKVELGTLSSSMSMVRSGVQHQGMVVKVDRGHDLALVHVPDLSSPTSIPLAAHDPVPGDHLFCIGNGRDGMVWHINDGIVSAIGVYAEMRALLASVVCESTDTKCAALEKAKRELHDFYSGKLLQSNCLLGGGDSGGPLIDDTGELIGVNVLTTAVNTSFHVPIDTVRGFLAGDRSEPVHVPPDPRQYNDNVPPRFLDLDRDGTFETVAFDARPQTLFVDLSGRSKTTLLDSFLALWLSEREATEEEIAAHRADLAAQRADLVIARDDVRDRNDNVVTQRLVAFYDDDGDGHFERVVVEAGQDYWSIRMRGEQGTLEAARPADLLIDKAARLAAAIRAQIKLPK